MKLNYLFVSFTIVCVFVLGNFTNTNAQLNEIVVQWDDPGDPGIPLRNALRNAILSDTLPDGSHAQNSVYKLLKGGIYWNTEAIDNSGYHLRIVGEPGDPNLNYEAGGAPPVIQRVYTDGGTAPAGKLIAGNGDLTLQNVYILHNDDLGAQTAYQPIELAGNGKRYTFDNVIFERTNFATVAVTNPNNDIFFTNCIFRNLIGFPSTQQWEGRGISLWTDQDTVVVENCTFFNINMVPLQLEGGIANYLRFNHNTIVNSGRQIAINGAFWKEAYFANNLIVNGFWHGEGNSDQIDPNRDPRSITSGIWGILDMAGQYGPEQGRRLLFAKTATWNDPLFAAYYADSIWAQPYVNPITREDFLDNPDPDYQMTALDTMWLADRPNMPTYFSNSFITDSMIQNIRDIRAGVNPAHEYFWYLPELPGGGVCHVCPSWYGEGPRGVPEDFSYTDGGLMAAGVGGLPLGDLNWFPTQKAQFEANKEQLIAEMEALAGPEFAWPVLDADEGEYGTLGGSSVIEPFQGFSYVAFTNSGNIVWEFDMASAQTVDLVVYTRSNDATRGQHIRVNGTGIRNDAGYGEYYWNANLTTAFQPFTVTQASLLPETQAALNLTAGTNTIELAPSWGYQDFVGVDVVVGGTTLFELRPPNANQPIVAPVQAVGAAYVPHYFNTVQLGGSGTIAWAFDTPTAGEYALNVYYQAPAGTQSIQIDAGGQTINPTFDGEVGDSSGLSKLSLPVVILGAGSNTFTLSGSNILVDWVQLVRKDLISSVTDRGELPDGFALSQNYPNPFNPTTKIDFKIAQASNVRMSIYNILGQRVITLLDTYMNAGTYTVDFDARHLASGVYFYSLEAGDYKFNKKMMLLK